MPGSNIPPVPIMRMFGVTELGNSVCCHVHGFSPYLYVIAPTNFNDHHCRLFKVSIYLIYFKNQYVSVCFKQISQIILLQYIYLFI